MSTTVVFPEGLRSGLSQRKHPQQSSHTRTRRPLLWAVHKSAHILACHVANQLVETLRLMVEVTQQLVTRVENTARDLLLEPDRSFDEITHFTIFPDLLR